MCWMGRRQVSAYKYHTHTLTIVSPRCPAFTKLTSDPYIFKDPEQCDKYWTCVKGESRRSLCPDGLVFHPEKPDGEDPCDLKANVPDKCKSRPNQQRPKPGEKRVLTANLTSLIIPKMCSRRASHFGTELPGAEHDTIMPLSTDPPPFINGAQPVAFGSRVNTSSL